MKKRKWLKRLLLASVLLLVVLVGTVVTAYLMSGSAPSWYRSKKLSSQEVAKLEVQARDKLLGLQNWAQDQSNWPAQASRPRVDTDPTTAPSNSRTITLSEDELNAIMSRWEQALLDKYGKYIADPYLGLRDGHIVLAVTMKEGGRVISAHVEPKLDDKGMLLLSTNSLMAGRITVPKAFWSGYTDKLAATLTGKLEQAREQARLEADGTGNVQAIISAGNRLLLNSLKDKPSDPVLFIPPDLEQWDKKGYPVKVVDVKVADQSLTLTVVTLSGPEQQQLLTRLRAPLGEEPPPPIAAKP